MLKRIVTLLAAWSALSGSSGCTAKPAAPLPDRVAFIARRGVNLGTWFTWAEQTSPSSYRQPLFVNPPGKLDDVQIEQLRRVGFDFVRLTVDPGVFVLLRGAERKGALDSLVRVIDQLNSHKLAVVVDMHPVRTIFPFGDTQGGGVQAYEKEAGSSQAQSYAAAVAWLGKQLDERYALTHRVAFELMNEPDLPCASPQWAKLILMLHRTVRAAAPKLALILNGACSDGIDGLTELTPSTFQDDNTLYTFHFYEDQRFTGAGIISGNSDHDLGLQSMGDLPYPWDSRPREQVLKAVELQALPKGEAAAKFSRRHTLLYLDQHWDQNKINERLDKVAQWAASNRIAPSRILMGEFGVNARRGAIRGPRDDDRLRWLADVRKAAEHQGFSWALWQYRGNHFNDDFGLETNKEGRLDSGTLAALGLISNQH